MHMASSARPVAGDFLDTAAAFRAAGTVFTGGQGAGVGCPYSGQVSQDVKGNLHRVAMTNLCLCKCVTLLCNFRTINQKKVWHKLAVLGHSVIYGTWTGWWAWHLCSHVWKPVKTRRRGWTHCLGGHSCWNPLCLCLSCLLILGNKRLILNSTQWKDKSTWDMIQIFIFSFFAVLARRRTRAHASAWGLSGGRLLGFSLIFCPAVGLQFCSARLALPDLLSCFWDVFYPIVLATFRFALICCPSLFCPVFPIFVQLVCNENCLNSQCLWVIFCPSFCWNSQALSFAS